MPDPKIDARYTVERLQRIPVHDFFGKLHDQVQITARHHLTGPTRLTLGAQEDVWLAEPDEIGEPFRPAPDAHEGRRPWAKRMRLPRRPPK
jgi:hypothetical protein